MKCPSLDRLAELETLAPDDDCPADARLSVPASDLRDLLALIPVVRASGLRDLTELTALAGKADELSPPDQLRLAAGLLDAAEPELALRVSEKVVNALHLALLVNGGVRG